MSEQQPLDDAQAKQLQGLGYTQATVTQKPGENLPVTAGQNSQPAKAKFGAVRAEPKNAKAPIDINGARQIAQQIARMETRHRELTARLDRLAQVFTEQGKPDQTKEIDDLRRRWEKRYSAAMDGYASALGPDLFAKVKGALQSSPAAGAGRHPGEPVAPTDNPAPKEKPERRRRG